jgi:hypothetical protein
MFSWRTNEEKLLCLKNNGSSSAENFSVLLILNDLPSSDQYIKGDDELTMLQVKVVISLMHANSATTYLYSLVKKDDKFGCGLSVISI